MAEEVERTLVEESGEGKEARGEENCSGGNCGRKGGIRGGDNN